MFINDSQILMKMTLLLVENGHKKSIINLTSKEKIVNSKAIKSLISNSKAVETSNRRL